ncbi:hypothetical protein BC827DRAFT_1224829 [Russula dissimulans]|nr:hypothetical protein BC827DRAFT_1224829 [Russula dissimulans]
MSGLPQPPAPLPPLRSLPRQPLPPQVCRCQCESPVCDLRHWRAGYARRRLIVSAWYETSDREKEDARAPFHLLASLLRGVFVCRLSPRTAVRFQPHSIVSPCMTFHPAKHERTQRHEHHLICRQRPLSVPATGMVVLLLVF